MSATGLEEYFARFRRHIVGYDQSFESPHGQKRIVYADWTASGRLYAPIEKRLSEDIGAFVGNTHTESTATGTRMTLAYRRAHEIIKEHVHASPDDVILTTGTGMTGAICKFQRILGLRIPERIRPFVSLQGELRPVVFVTHMEHHSNHTSWLESIAEVVCIEPDERGLVSPANLARALERYRDRTPKIGAFTACSNVTGVMSPYHALAEIMHEHGGYCFVDFAASAPYVNIDMHPADPNKKLDAIFFSPHKFLGGPGSPGVLIFDSMLYCNEVPDHPGGGTVDWTNPWGGRKYVDDIEEREDGGTPGFLQAMKAALAVRLKEEMTVDKMLAREEELVAIMFEELPRIPGVIILAGHIRQRLGIVSFYVENAHFNLIVRLLNDRYGIQVRGGCSCAGTYGHYLLHVDRSRSQRITDLINRGDLSEKPGWIRLSLHPTMTDAEAYEILVAIREVVKHHATWSRDYRYCRHRNEFLPREPLRQTMDETSRAIDAWFSLTG